MDTVNIESLQRQFAQIGAELEISVREPPTIQVEIDKNGKLLPSSKRRMATARTFLGGNPFVASIRGTGKNEHFRFRIDPELLKSVQVVDVDRNGRHLLLNVQALPPKDQKDQTDLPTPQKLLMGHDEFHFFIAPVPRSAINVNAAKQALKPTPVQEAQRKTKVRVKHLHKRHQAAFIRQGEWFFLPAPDLVVDPKLIHRDEPIRRGAGKPHNCEELYRTGGRTVMVSSRHPNGISMADYNKLSVNERRDQGPTWRQMTADPTAYVRGKVMHADHRTIRLQGWHRVQVNNETTLPVRFGGVVSTFLD
jgi:hypothetical protein